MPDGRLDGAGLAALVEAFGQEHLRTYGHRGADEPVELVNVRVAARLAAGWHRTYDAASVLGARTGQAANDRLACFGPRHGRLRTPVVRRQQLGRPGEPGRPGPLIVAEYDTTCLVPPGCVASLDDSGNIVIDVDVDGHVNTDEEVPA